MIDRLWDEIFDYFKSRPYWARIQPVVVFLFLFLVATVSAYEYIEWQYHLALPIPLFLQSHVFKQILVAALSLAALGLVLAQRRRRAGSSTDPHARAWRRLGTGRIAAACVVVAGAVIVAVRLSPVQANRIQVRFMTEPGKAFDKYAVVYLLYELNKAQKGWFFDIDFDTFNPAELTSKERQRCEGDELCQALILSHGQPFIGITTNSLGEHSFWQNQDSASVVSTSEWTSGSSPDVYEYLTYSLVVQSMLLHLNTRCGGLPPAYFEDSRTASGDLFQFSPRRAEMRPQVLAAHLNPSDRTLLLKCFGIEYMNTCSDLMTLDWLRTKKVTDNLRRAFGVEVGGGASHVAAGDVAERPPPTAATPGAGD